MSFEFSDVRSTLISRPPRVEGIGWRSPQWVQRLGKSVHCARLPDGWWAIWREHKEALKALGYTCRKDLDDCWELAWWTAGNGLPLRTVAEIEALVIGEDASRVEVPAVLPDLPEWVAALLRGYQIDHTRRLLLSQQLHRASLDSSPMGLGKTYIGVGLAAALGLKPYVVTPKPVIGTWVDCFRHFGLEGEVMNYEALRSSKGKAWLKTSQAGRGKAYEWTLPKDVLIIGDEIHRAGNEGTITTRIMLAAVRQGYHMHVASGTAAKDPCDMRFLGAMCKFHSGTPGDFRAWARENKAQVNGWGKLEFTGTPRDLAAIHRKIYPAFGSQLRIADLPPGSMPDNQLLLDPVELDGGTSREINRAYSDAAKESEKIRRDSSLSNSQKSSSILAEMMRARKASERLKLPFVLDEAKARMSEGYSVILGFCFRDHLFEAAEAMGSPNHLIIGAQPEAERAEALRAFQAGDKSWIVVGLDAGGVGISLHDLGPIPRPRYVFAPISFDAVAFVQFLGRAPRNGAITPVQQRIVLASGTIEEELSKSIRRKVNNLNHLHSSDLCAGLSFDL